MTKSYQAIALVYVDIVNPSTRLCQAAVKFRAIKSSELVLEIFLPTLRVYNPLAGNLSPAAEEKPRLKTSSAERGG